MSREGMAPPGVKNNDHFNDIATSFVLVLVFILGFSDPPFAIRFAIFIQKWFARNRVTVNHIAFTDQPFPPRYNDNEPFRDDKSEPHSGMVFFCIT